MAASAPGHGASSAHAGPQFQRSGALSQQGSGVALKYSPSLDASHPVNPWRLFVLKGEEQVGMYSLGSKTAYLVGRDRLVVDIPADHASVSKQHAAIQFRLVKKANAAGKSLVIAPFLLDLGSTNGSFVNGTPVPPGKYYELRSGDVLKLGHSTRDYVLLEEEEKRKGG